METAPSAFDITGGSQVTATESPSFSTTATTSPGQAMDRELAVPILSENCEISSVTETSWYKTCLWYGYYTVRTSILSTIRHNVSWTRSTILKRASRDYFSLALSHSPDSRNAPNVSFKFTEVRMGTGQYVRVQE